MKSIEWNGDFKECRAAADRRKFDAKLAEAFGKAAYNDYINQEWENGLGEGPSLKSTNFFTKCLNTDPRLKDFSEREAKILFLGASDVFSEILSKRQNRGRLEERRTAVEQCFREIVQLYLEQVDIRLESMGTALSCPSNPTLKKVQGRLEKALKKHPYSHRSRSAPMIDKTFIDNAEKALEFFSEEDILFHMTMGMDSEKIEDFENRFNAAMKKLRTLIAHAKTDKREIKDLKTLTASFQAAQIHLKILTLKQYITENDLHDHLDIDSVIVHEIFYKSLSENLELTAKGITE